MLKRILKQPRPSGIRCWCASTVDTGVQTTYGMPSDHSQFMSCLCIYITLWLSFESLRGCSVTYSVCMSSSVQRYFAIVVMWVVWVFVVSSRWVFSPPVICRLYLGEHTLEQVVVGIGIGFAYGLTWYAVNKRVFRKYYQTIADWPFFKWLEFKVSLQIG